MEHYRFTATIENNFVGLKKGMFVTVDLPIPFDKIAEEIHRKYGIKLSGEQVESYEKQFLIDITVDIPIPDVPKQISSEDFDDVQRAWMRKYVILRDPLK